MVQLRMSKKKRKKEIWDSNYEPLDLGKNMDVKREFNKDDECDGELSLTENLVGSFEREYNTGDILEGDLGGSGDSGGSLYIKFSSDRSVLESNEENGSPLASQRCTQ